MKSYDYYAYTTPDGGVICKHCTGKLSQSQETARGLHPIFADSEWDFYPVCDRCHREQDYVSLTNVGRAYGNKIRNYQGKVL